MNGNLQVVPRSETVLETQGLVRHYRSQRWRLGPPVMLRALDGVSLSLGTGEILGVVGESGCGKSTLARLIANIDRPTAGVVKYRGRAVSQLSRRDWRPLRRKIQIVLQNTRATLDPRWTAIDQVSEPLIVHGLGEGGDCKERAGRLLSQFGLHSHLWDRYPHQLSGGQCQRVALARAMILDPELLVCDEPTSATDVSVQAQVVNLLWELRNSRGLAMVFISHNLGVVRHLCDRVAVMYLGRVVEVAERDRLFCPPPPPPPPRPLSAVPGARPAGERDRIYLAGEPPSPIDPPAGCAFHPRCPQARGACRVRRPELKPLGRGYQVACHAVHGEA